MRNLSAATSRIGLFLCRHALLLSCHPANVPGLAGNTVKQKWPAGDRLTVVIGVRQPHEQAPPVAGERDQPHDVLAALEIPRAEATQHLPHLCSTPSGPAQRLMDA